MKSNPSNIAGQDLPVASDTNPLVVHMLLAELRTLRPDGFERVRALIQQAESLHITRRDLAVFERNDLARRLLSGGVPRVVVRARIQAAFKVSRATADRVIGEALKLPMRTAQVAQNRVPDE